MKLQKLLLLFFSVTLILNSCTTENENFQDENQFNLESYQEISNKIQKDLNGIFKSKKDFGNSNIILTSASNYYNENQNFKDFESIFNLKTRDFKSKSNDQLSLNENEDSFLKEIDEIIYNANSETEALNKLTELSEEIKSKVNFTIEDKNFAIGTIILSIEYLRFLENNPQSQAKGLSYRYSWWDCMRETGGKKIARGLVYGFVVGLRGGIKGAAGGAVIGAVGGAIWAAADCI